MPFLPWGFETFWWGGVPYYYADDTFYNWDPAAGEYVTVPPPDETADADTGTYAQASPGESAAPDESAGGPMATPDLYAYPKKDQSAEQQARDRDECRTWAQGQTGFDPAEPHETSEAEAAKRGTFLRAEAACLQARDYSVK